MNTILKLGLSIDVISYIYYIIEIVGERCTGSKICCNTNITYSHVSFILKKLVNNGIISFESKGREKIVHIIDKDFCRNCYLIDLRNKTIDTK